MATAKNSIVKKNPYFYDKTQLHFNTRKVFKTKYNLRRSFRLGRDMQQKAHCS